jgi:hypothetical protein
VGDRRRDEHVTSLLSTGKCKRAAPGDNRARPQKGKDVVSRKGCGQLPARLSPSAGKSRKGVPLLTPSPVSTNFVYVSVKYRVWCRPKIYEENMLIKLYKNTAYKFNLLKDICCHYNRQKQQIIEKRGKRK